MAFIDDVTDYFILGGITVLIGALFTFIGWGVFVSENEMINSVTTIMGFSIVSIIVLILIGFLVREYVFN